MSDEVELKPMSKKHQRVLDEYLLCFNQTKAYRVVYPATTYDSARTASARLFADDNFSGHLKAKLSEVTMTAEEALKLHSEIARGDIGDLLDNNGLLDIRLAKASGKTRLLRKIKQKTITRIGKKEDDDDIEITEIEFEMYPADAAQERILKVHGKFTDKIDISNPDGTLKPEKEVDDTRAEILRKLASIATATGADKLSGKSDAGTT